MVRNYVWWLEIDKALEKTAKGLKYVYPIKRILLRNPYNRGSSLEDHGLAFMLIMRDLT